MNVAPIFLLKIQEASQSRNVDLPIPDFPKIKKCLAYTASTM